MCSVGNVNRSMMLQKLNEYNSIENFYARYIKVNQFLHSLVARQIISDYRIIELFPKIKVEIKPDFTPHRVTYESD